MSYFYKLIILPFFFFLFLSAEFITSGFTVQGNTYTDYDENFVLVAPGQNWVIQTIRNGVLDINKEATVIFHLNEIYYSMVIAEEYPNVDITKYLELVKPGLEKIKTIYQNPIMTGGVKGVSLKFTGYYSDLNLVYYQTVYQSGDWYYQILSWCQVDGDSSKTKAQFQKIAKSFKLVK